VTRVELMAIAEKHGWRRGQEPSSDALRAIEKEVSDWLSSPEGERALQEAPKSMCYTVDGDNVIAGEKRKEDVLHLIMSEFRGEDRA